MSNADSIGLLELFVKCGCQLWTGLPLCLGERSNIAPASCHLRRYVWHSGRNVLSTLAPLYYKETERCTVPYKLMYICAAMSEFELL